MMKTSNAAVRGLTAIFLAAAASFGTASLAQEQPKPPKVADLTTKNYETVDVGDRPSFVIFDKLVEMVKDGYINPDIKDEKMVADAIDGMAGYIAGEATKADLAVLNAKLDLLTPGVEKIPDDLQAAFKAQTDKYNTIKQSILDAAKAPDAHRDLLINDLVNIVRKQNEHAKQKNIADIKAQLKDVQKKAAAEIKTIQKDKTLSDAQKKKRIGSIQGRKDAIEADAKDTIDQLTKRPAINEAAVKDGFRLEYAVKQILENHPDLNGKEKKLIEAGLDGILSSLDPHSSFFDEEGTADFQKRSEAAFGGIGLEITKGNGGVVAVKPVNDTTPAARAHVQKNDMIVKIDGQDATKMTVAEVADKIHGELGSKIKVEFKREGAQDPIVIEFTRERIKTPSVDQKVLTSENGKKVGYITMRDFNDQDIPGELEQAFQKLGDVDSYILNLENNPGGLLDFAVQTADDFLESGEIVSEVARDPRGNKSWSAEPGDLAQGKPVTVMINSNSASASEIVTGALKGNNRVTVVGTRSYGKGSVQTVAPFGYYTNDSQLKMWIPNTRVHYTTGLYLTPNRVSIQGLGITPDIEARLPISKPENDRHESDNKSMIANPNAPDVVVNDKPKESCTLRAEFNAVATLPDDYVLHYGDPEKTTVNVPLVCAVGDLTGRFSNIVEFKPWVAPVAAPVAAPRPH